MDHGGLVASFSLAVGVLELFDGGDLDYVNAPAGGVGGDVYTRNVLLVFQVRAGATLAVLGTKALGAARLRQGTNGGKTVVLQQHVDNLDAFLGHGG